MIEEEVNELEQEKDDDDDDDEDIDANRPAKNIKEKTSSFMSRLQMLQKGPNGGGSTGTPPLISRFSAQNRQVFSLPIACPEEPYPLFHSNPTCPSRVL